MSIFSSSYYYRLMGDQRNPQRRLNVFVTMILGTTLFAMLFLVIILGRSKDKQDKSHFPGPFSERIDAKTAAVASENGICSEAGVEMLRRGGSAVDAAISAALCIGVTNAFSSGIGGGGFLLVRDANANFSFFDFRETAPSKAHKDMFKEDPKRAQIGGLSIAVPGEIRGFEAAHSRFGKLPWSVLFQPAIDVAQDGWVANAVLENRVAGLAEMIIADTDGFALDYAPNGRLVKEGDVVKRPRLAKTLASIAFLGSDAFYEGPIAESLIKTITSANGIITLEDFKNYAARELEPLVGYYHGRKVVTCPAPSSGAMLLSILNIIEGFDFKSRGNTSDTVHLLIEAFKFGAAQRGLLGDRIDPIYRNITAIEKIITNKDLAAKIRHLTSIEKTFDPKHYQPQFEAKEDHGTMHVSVLAPDNSAASLTSTVNLIFGSQIMDPRTGIILNDEMDDFSIPGHPNAFGLAPSPYNFIHPHKRPLSSMIPTIIERDGVPEIVIGASGGSMIPTCTIASILNMVDFNLDINDAIDLPRFHHQLFPNVIRVENAFSAAISADLEAKGHVIERSPPGQKFVGVSGIRRLASGLITAASDARKGGLAAGY
ncbi:hypothetical protein HK100_003401 [Physocladia obscura]|uniref:Glutathione hydrolase n=1 Tax=Physocladia obscura TaxID=109957 RepID=A0AAD5SWR0_9FUNG|nr:hypothetical protein HK100_003401 [Physocladia obscura]